MKFYNGLESGKRLQTIRVTLQDGIYIGHISYKVGGNCAGLNVLDWDPECIDQDDIDRYVANDCKFRFNEDEELFLFTLHDETGNECDYECDTEDVKRCVVCVEIVECEGAN